MSENQYNYPTCKNCGARFTSNDSNSVCPKCGGKSKIIDESITLGINLSMRWKMTGKRLGKKLFEMIFGHEQSTRLSRLVEKNRLIDWENDMYEESVIDPKTGQVIHECKEKLSQHTGHGSAKSKGDKQQ